MLSQLNYPLKSITVPMWVVPIFCILLPLLIFSTIYYCWRDVYDLHHATLGLLYSSIVAGAITGALKDIVGRPRPDFLWMCFPDGKPVFDQVTGDVICNGDKNTVKDAYRSFPSGHSSWSFAGLTFLTLYVAGKVRLCDGRAHLFKSCIVIIPFLIAILIGISLIDDYIHNWTDVLAGGYIGIACAVLCYLQIFPLPCHRDGWAPWAYFKALDEARACRNPMYTANNRAEGDNGSGAQQNKETLDDLETGRKARYNTGGNQTSTDYPQPQASSSSRKQ